MPRQKSTALHSIDDTRRRFLSYFSSIGLTSTLLPGALWTQVEASAQAQQGSQPAVAPSPQVTVDMLKTAEKIAGLEFTDADRDLIIDGVNQQLARYQRIRDFPLPNSVPTCLIFNPVLGSMKFDMLKRPLRMSKRSYFKRPSSLEDAAFLPVTRLSQLIRSRQVTSVELTGMYLDRLKRYNEKLNFVITFTPDLAMEQATKADAEIAAGKYRGPLHGIPWGAKDLIAKKGYKTTWGAAPYKDQSFDYDATIIERLESAGAVLLAKLSTGELAGGDTWFGGQTKNPWNPMEGSSGSSAGPASATGAGCVGFAVGTETGGSILGPSTRCCVNGLRPTFGRISRYGVMTLAWSLDKAGPICRGVEDTALVLHALQGRDGKDMSVTDVPFNWDAAMDIRKLRVAYIKSDFDGSRGTPEENKINNAALDKLRSLGVNLKPVEFPELPLVRDLMPIMYTEFSAAFDDLTRSRRSDMLARQGRGSDATMYRTNRFVPAVEYIQATRIRSLLLEAMDQMMQDVDVYITAQQGGGGAGGRGAGGRGAADAGVADGRGANARGARGGGGAAGPVSNTTLTNLTGHPSIVIRNGVNAAGRPTMMVLTGKIYGEAAMLAVAHAYEMATDWHNLHPDMNYT